MKAIVDGLELFAVKGKYGIYLKCDDCGAVIDADADPATGRISSNEEQLIKKAIAAGWTGDFTRSCDNDRCPVCSAEARYNSAASPTLKQIQSRFLAPLDITNLTEIMNCQFPE